MTYCLINVQIICFEFVNSSFLNFFPEDSGLLVLLIRKSQHSGIVKYNFRSFFFSLEKLNIYNSYTIFVRQTCYYKRMDRKNDSFKTLPYFTFSERYKKTRVFWYSRLLRKNKKHKLASCCWATKFPTSIATRQQHSHQLFNFDFGSINIWDFISYFQIETTHGLKHITRLVRTPYCVFKRGRAVCFSTNVCVLLLLFYQGRYG